MHRNWTSSFLNSIAWISNTILTFMLNVFFYYLLFLYMFSIMVVLHRHSISSLYLSELNSFHLRPFGGHLCKRKGLYLLTENLWVMQLILKQPHSTSPWSIETTVEILNAKGLIKNLHYIFFQFTSILAKKKKKKIFEKSSGKPRWTSPIPPS